MLPLSCSLSVLMMRMHMHMHMQHAHAHARECTCGVQVPENVCKDRHNNVRRVRLWTSSLQRTIRTVRLTLTLT